MSKFLFFLVLCTSHFEYYLFFLNFVPFVKSCFSFFFFFRLCALTVIAIISFPKVPFYNSEKTFPYCEKCEESCKEVTLTREKETIIVVKSNFIIYNCVKKMSGMNGLPLSKPSLAFRKYQPAGNPKNRERLNVGRSNKTQFQLQKTVELEDVFLKSSSVAQLPVGTRLVAQRFNSDKGTNEMMASRRKAASALRLALEGGRGEEKGLQDHQKDYRNGFVPPPTPPPPPTNCVCSAKMNVNALEVHPGVNYLERQNRHGKGHQISPENYFLSTPTPKYPSFTLNMTGKEASTFLKKHGGCASVAIQRPFIIPDSYVQERLSCGGGMLEYNDPTQDTRSHNPHCARFHIIAAEASVGTETDEKHPFFLTGSSAAGSDENDVPLEKKANPLPCCLHLPHVPPESDEKKDGAAEKFVRKVHSTSHKNVVQEGGQRREEAFSVSLESAPSNLGQCPFCSLKNVQQEKYGEDSSREDDKRQWGQQQKSSVPPDESTVPIWEGVMSPWQKEGNGGGNATVSPPPPSSSTSSSLEQFPRPCPYGCYLCASRSCTKSSSKTCGDSKSTLGSSSTSVSPTSTRGSAHSHANAAGCVSKMGDSWRVPHNRPCGKAHTLSSSSNTTISASSSNTSGAGKEKERRDISELHSPSKALECNANGDNQRSENSAPSCERHDKISVSSSTCSSFSSTAHPKVNPVFSPHRSLSSPSSSSHRLPSHDQQHGNSSRNSSEAQSEEEIAPTIRSHLPGRHPLFSNADKVARIPPRYAYPNGQLGEEYKDTITPGEEWILSYTPSAKPWQVPPFLGRCGYKDKSLTFGIVQAAPSTALCPTAAEQYNSVAHCPLLTPCDRNLPRKGVRRYRGIPK